MRKLSAILAGFETLPEADIATVLGGKRPLILAPHPDDESLGCGGLIAAACAAGVAPAIIVLTDGSASHPGSKMLPQQALAELREQEVLSAVRILGVPDGNLHLFRQPDGALASQGAIFEALVARAAAIGVAHNCGMVIGPWAGDPHCDHQAAAKIAEALATSRGWPLLSYPVWGWLRDPDEVFDESRGGGWRLEIAAFQALKQQAIAAHASQCSDLINDSPNGFRLPASLLQLAGRNFEVLIK